MSEALSRSLLLVNCSTNLSLRTAKEAMDREGKLIYHCRAGPVRMEPKPLHMVASRDPFGSATASILCLYWATWSSGSVVPSYAFTLGKENFLGISIKVILSMKGVSVIGLRVAVLHVVGLSIVVLFSRRCVSSRRLSWKVRACPGVGCFQSRHRTNLSPELTLLVACRVKGLVLVSECKILRFELAELLGALLYFLGVLVELFLQDLELQGKLGIGLFPSSMQPGYLTLQIFHLPLEFGFSMGSSSCSSTAIITFSLSEVFHFPEEGGDPGTGPGKLHSEEPGFLLVGIQRPVSCLGSGGIQYLSEPLALDGLGCDSEGLYLLVGDCNSMSNARFLTSHSLLFQVNSSKLVEVAGG
ncbi:hypothetical protein DY000_02007591 [Brassica cretica]|uniref:Uncharacterized protein n=1 Tax=Brassica cretica TaxID=69181 RepID=A0ABQ7CFS8_BRACR|nr:hypothetical protein DY000_02007591 [Brassica cretica]